ncbi:O-antigen ligase family protein, partial [Lactiplantibacillus plantarum]|uniref:O-antigen ligase family protein n=1 Tax=Lactiplantibacillus plantarum TaxID=1590 RepID=UPI001C9E998E
MIVFIGYKNKNSRFSISKKKIIGGAAVFLALLLIVFHKPIIQKLFIDRGNTSGERFKQYVNAWNTGVLHHPFTGVGIGQWQSYSYYNFGYVDLPIHSLYYNVLIE